MKMTWNLTIYFLKVQKVREQDFESACDYRSIERSLENNTTIEQIFDCKDTYTDSVKKELIKLERRTKLQKINNIK
jgi:hypothetical protein